MNWYRGPDEPPDNPCWDSHTRESERLKTVLAPTLDQAVSALLEDLAQRGMLDETLVLCLAEFGRTPRFNARGGRDHWGHVFLVARLLTDEHDRRMGRAFAKDRLGGMFVQIASGAARC